MIKFIASFLMVLTVTLCCGAAHAREDMAGALTRTTAVSATRIPADSKGFFENLEGAASKLLVTVGTNVPSELVGYAMKIAVSPAVKDNAYKIAGSLATMYFFFEIIRTLGKDGRTIVAIVVDVGIPLLIAGLLISEYAPCMKKFGYLLDAFSNIAGPNPAGNVIKMYKEVLGSIGNAISGALSLSAITKGVLGNWNAFALNALLTVLFSLIILAIVIMGIADVFALFLMGPFLFAIGVAFGPLLIAGIVTPWTRDYFTKWIQFIVASAVLTGVVSVIFKLSGELFTYMGMHEHTKAGTESTAVSMITLAIMMLAVNNLIGQAPSIASALIPGSLGVSSGNSGLGKLVKSAIQSGKGVKKFFS
jgi:hypothetical protein